MRKLCFLSLSLLWASVNATSDEKNEMIIVKDGVPNIEIVYSAEKLPFGEAVYPPLDYPKSSEVLAKFIADYFFESTGKRPLIALSAGKDKNKISLHLGPTDYVKTLSVNVGDFDEDEFCVLFPDETNIAITGKYQHGVEWGTYEFLERYLGVRWLSPGKLGTEIPAWENLKIATAPIRQKPTFLTRNIGFDNGKPELTDWARNSRLRRRICYHHNLGILFHPSVYKTKRPDFFPERKGERPVPGSVLCAWQPCFSAKGIVEEAVGNIRQHFKTHPNAKSFSLGVNDISGFCECRECLKKDGANMNYIGVPDRSNSYYEFCDKVARGVLTYCPEKQFGLLAYGDVALPPNAPLHPAVVPFITYDRMSWLDKTVRAEGHRVNALWEKKTSTLGWYDYLYGDCYAIPRIYFHEMADFIQYGAEHKVRHFTAEAYMSDDFREGPKAYLTMKLLWNSKLDVDRELMSWYRTFAGAEAAPWVKKYFSLWEDFWTKRVPESEWFKKYCQRTYLEYSDIGYFSVAREEDFSRGEALLATALSKTKTDKQAQRVKKLINGLLEAKDIVLSKNNYERLNEKREKAKSEKIVETASFDKSFDGWGSWKGEYSGAAFSRDAKVGHNAQGSLLIDRNGDKNAVVVCGVVFMKHFAVAHGKTYRISVWAKSEDTKPDVEIKIVTRWRERDMIKWVNFMSMTRETALKNIVAGKWRKIDMLVNVPNNPKIHYIVVLLTVDKTNVGKVWFDDFSLEEVSLSDAEKNNQQKD